MGCKLESLDNNADPEGGLTNGEGWQEESGSLEEGIVARGCGGGVRERR